MLRISTKGRYGLRSMVDLAVYSSDAPVSLSSIADRQGLSTGYLEQVFSALRKAGLVTGIKGMGGGYILSQEPSSITVGDVLRVLEGNLNVADSKGGSPMGESSIEYCIENMVWKRMNEALNRAADSVTLDELATEHKKLNNSWDHMYYI